MSDLILFPVKTITGGSAINKSTGRAIGRPRTRAPRKAARGTLEPDEVKQLTAPRLSLMPAAVEKALPPFRRLTLAQQCERAYARQQPRITQQIASKRDRVVHSEQVLGWRVEVLQKGSTRGTDTPLYFYRTENLTLGASGGQVRCGKWEYSTPQDCLEMGRLQAGEREKLWRGRGRNTSPLPTKTRRRRRYGYIEPSLMDAKLIAAVTSCDCPIGDATCPVCRKRIERNSYAVRSHLRPHVKKGLIQSNQAEDIFSFLVAPRHESRMMHT